MTCQGLALICDWTQDGRLPQGSFSRRGREGRYLSEMAAVPAPRGRVIEPNRSPDLDGFFDFALYLMTFYEAVEVGSNMKAHLKSQGLPRMDYRRVTHHRRIHLTKEILDDFFLNIFRGLVSEFAGEKGLQYHLIYNLVHGRIRSVSARDYRRIFGKQPPYQTSEKVDGEYFRGMVRLWLFLNGDATSKDLYREFYPGKKCTKPDYRIFNGETRTIDISLEETMEAKFFDQGFQRPEIRTWMEEFQQSKDQERVPYEKTKPILDYLRDVLKINLKAILNQSITRYESGELKTISMEIHHLALNLKERAEKALQSGSKFEVENLREKVSGKKEGFTLFSEMEDELEFVLKHRGKRSKQYLGRGIGDYKKSKLIRIDSRRAEKIRNDFERLIKERPETHVMALPKSHMRLRVSELLVVLKSLLIRRLIEDESGTYERLVLSPSGHNTEKYGREGYIDMNYAAFALDIRKKAFDLMVAMHSDIFRKVARYNGKWGLSNLYIKELKAKEGFSIVKAKYELLARGDNCCLRSRGRGEETRLPDTQSSPMVARDYHEVQGPVYHLMDRESSPPNGTSTKMQEEIQDEALNYHILLSSLRERESSGNIGRMIWQGWLLNLVAR